MADINHNQDEGPEYLVNIVEKLLIRYRLKYFCIFFVL